MGIFDFLKKHRKAPESAKYMPMLNGYAPLFSQYGQEVYADDVVQQALACIVGEIKKLRPQHIAKRSEGNVSVDSDVQAVLENPNPIMTTADFLEKTAWMLFLNCNSFIIPQWSSDGRLEALWPVQPVNVTFLQDASGTMFVTFQFQNLYQCTVRYDDVIHIRHRYSVNEVMGGNEYGQPDNEGLRQTLGLNDSLLKGVAKALNASYAVNGVVKYNSILDNGKTEAALKELTERLSNDESGFLGLDLKAEFIPLKREVQMVDEATLKFIDEKILRNYGVPLCILTGDYTKEQYEAFFQKTIEGVIESYSQAFTKTLFTKRARYGYGNRVMFYSEDLIFMTMSQKLELVRLLGDSGALYENEKREIFGMRPLPELNGVRLQSLNYVDTEYAKEYQTKAKEVENDQETSE